jgi:hypothetical protein
MEYRHVEGTQEVRPLEFDATTSKTVVYVRKNIERVAKITEQGNYQAWEYDEAEIPYDDFASIASVLISNGIPYTATKTAYIGDSEVVFPDAPEGNLSVYVKDSEGNYPSYTVERISDRIRVSFEPVEYVTEVTISII